MKTNEELDEQEQESIEQIKEAIKILTETLKERCEGLSDSGDMIRYVQPYMNAISKLSRDIGTLKEATRRKRP